MKNIVIAGDYKISCSSYGFSGIPYIAKGFGGKIKLDKTTVSEYEVIDENYRCSATSAVGKAAVGSFFLGPVGLLAGLGAKRKGIHTVAIQFFDGKKSLIEIDDAIYKMLMKALF